MVLYHLLNSLEGKGIIIVGKQLSKTMANSSRIAVQLITLTFRYPVQKVSQTYFDQWLHKIQFWSLILLTMAVLRLTRPPFYPTNIHLHPCFNQWIIRVVLLEVYIARSNQPMQVLWTLGNSIFPVIRSSHPLPQILILKVSITTLCRIFIYEFVLLDSYKLTMFKRNSYLRLIKSVMSF